MSIRNSILFFVCVCALYWAVKPQSSTVLRVSTESVENKRKPVLKIGEKNQQDVQMIYIPSTRRSIAKVSSLKTTDSGQRVQDTGNFEEPMLVNVYVFDERGNLPSKGRVLSQVCGIDVPVDKDGFVNLELNQGCDLFASRADGLFLSFTEEVWVDHQSGEEIDLDLVLSTDRIGGLGVQIAKVSDGFRIEYVYPNTPAEHLNVATGSIITEVNGVETYDLSILDFIQLTTGKVGTEVKVRFLNDLPDEPPHRFVRSVLEGP